MLKKFKLSNIEANSLIGNQLKYDEAVTKESAQILSKICALFQYPSYLCINFNF
jgi:hypothetical protein